MSASTTLGDFFRVRKEKGEAGLPTLSVTMNDGLVDRADLDRKMETNLAPEEHLRVREGDIVYNMMRMWQGAFGRAEKDGIVSPAYVVVEPREKIDSRFAAHWFKSARMIHLFWAYSYGLTEDRLRLYAEDFCRIPVTVPSIKEQGEAVLLLDACDNAIAAVGALITAKNRFLNKLIHSLGQDSWFPVALGDLGKWVGGGTPSKGVSSYWIGDIPWVSPKDMSTWRIDDTEDHISEEAIAKSSTRLVPTGSVLVVTRSGILRNTVPSAVTNVPVAINQDIKALQIDGPWSGSLIALVMRQASEQLRQACVKTGTTVESIDLEALKAMPIALPDTDEATADAENVVVGLARELDLLTAQLDRLQLQKRGLMQRLFSGDALTTEAAE